jgi:hypothetical protein
MAFRARAAQAVTPSSSAARRKRVALRAATPSTSSTAPSGGSSTADPITDAQRASAARIRMSYDKKRGHKTEGWIRNLARQA